MGTNKVVGVDGSDNGWKVFKIQNSGSTRKIWLISSGIIAKQYNTCSNKTTAENNISIMNKFATENYGSVNGVLSARVPTLSDSACYTNSKLLCNNRFWIATLTGRTYTTWSGRNLGKGQLYGLQNGQWNLLNSVNTSWQTVIYTYNWCPMYAYEGSKRITYNEHNYIKYTVPSDVTRIVAKTEKPTSSTEGTTPTAEACYTDYDSGITGTYDGTFNSTLGLRIILELDSNVYTSGNKITNEWSRS